MKRILSRSTPILLAAAVLIFGVVMDAEAAPKLRTSKEANVSSGVPGLKLLDPATRANKDCVDMVMSCNSTVNGVLDETDCVVDVDNSRIDFWVFDGTAGMDVTINLTSNEFDTWAFLFTPLPAGLVFGSNDDVSEGNTNSRIQATLNETGEWAIGANGFDATELGNYTIQLDCKDGQPQDPPAAPSNLTATATSSTEIQLQWDDNSNNETEFRVELRGPGGNFVDIGSVPADSTQVTVIQLDPMTTYDFQVRARNSGGNSAYTNVASATTLGGAGVCVPSDTTICLLDGRFSVEVDWMNFDNVVGQGREVFSSDDSTLLYFFEPDNWEFLVKMLDACGPPFDSFWVFAAATTNVEYTLRITDTETGVVQTYFNPLGTGAPAITDTDAFTTCP